MTHERTTAFALCVWLVGCAHDAATVGSLSRARVEVQPSTIEAVELEQAIAGYRQYLAHTADERSKPRVLRRLADLEMARLERDQAQEMAPGERAPGATLPARRRLNPVRYDSAIALYLELLRTYPGYPGNDEALYQLAHAYEQNGDQARTLQTLQQLVSAHPGTPRLDEAQFRRGELLFVQRSYGAAEQAYAAVVDLGERSALYERALYKHGWALFKQSRYETALDSFFGVLDRRFRDSATGEIRAEASGLTRGEQELLDDSFRVVSLSFSYLNGHESITRYLDAHGGRPYAYALYENLGELYLKQERYVDAADTFGEFARRHAEDPRAPLLQVRVMEAHQRGGFSALLLQAKEDFVTRYGVASAPWKRYDEATRARLAPHLKTHLEELARHYHAQAQRNREPQSYAQAARWYRDFVTGFGDDSRAPEMHFLLAEALLEMKRYNEAAEAYEQTAYRDEQHPRAAEAGYAAILAHQKHEQTLAGAARGAHQRRTLASALRFAAAFPQDRHTPAVLTKAAEELFTLREYAQAAAAARGVTALQPAPPSALRRTAWTVIGHSEFERQDYASAEEAYGQALRLVAQDDAKRPPLVERLAASVYKQGEALRTGGDLRGAVAQFERVAQVASGSTIAPTAQYDAAAGRLSLRDWNGAIALLEDFNRRHPSHPLRAGVPEKLALAYGETGQWARAASQFEALADLKADPQVRREALWQAAELHEKAGGSTAAAQAYARYAASFPEPFAPALEARHRAAAAYDRAGAQAERQRLLAEIVRAVDSQAGPHEDRARYLAAHAAFTLAEPVYQAFRRVGLAAPLKRSLMAKKERMQVALKAYARVADYGVAEFTTAATFRIAEIYHGLSRDLLTSERPQELKGPEREQYDVLLEEQAYPFEEKAIEIHEVNAKRVAQGVYDEWVQRSFNALGKLRPVRYSKVERSEGVSRAIR